MRPESTWWERYDAGAAAGYRATPYSRRRRRRCALLLAAFGLLMFALPILAVVLR